MRLAVIPARGGSKRIARKNVRSFAGKPMIGYAIDAATRSGLFSAVVVSTDDEEIAAVARALGAAVPFIRPAELADDHTPTVPVIAHAIQECRQLVPEPEAVCCIYPSVPMLAPHHLRLGLDQLQRGLGQYVFPVLAFPSPVQRALRREEDGRTRPFYPEYAATRTQDLEPAFYDAGQFYWGYPQAWLQGLSLHAHGTTVLLPEGSAIDIDTPHDWVRAEALFKVMAGERHL